MEGDQIQVAEVPYSIELTCGLRGKWKGVKETEWCRFAMERHSDWMPILGRPTFDRFDLEYQVRVNDSKTRRSGLPRFDAVGWRGGKASIVEAKVDITPSTVMGGVGQLLYYYEVAKRLIGWEVEELILITPAWPAYLVDTLERFSIPVSLVQVNPSMIYGRRASVASN